MFKKIKQLKVEETTYLNVDKTDYPNGTFVRTENGQALYLKNGFKYRVGSEKSLESWRPAQIAACADSAIAHYKAAGTLGFRAGTLIQDISDSKYYLIEDNKKRHIQDPRWFALLGFELYDALLVSHTEANLHQEGEALI